MQRSDPEPVDIDLSFFQVVRACVQRLSAYKSTDRAEAASLLRRHLLAQPLVLAVLEDFEWQRSIRQAAVPVPSEVHQALSADVAKQVVPGDVLNVSYYRLPHKVIVETCRYSAADNRLAVRAINYGRLSLLQPVTVLQDDFNIVCDGSKAWLHTFPNSVLYSADESLARAKSRLGERQHHPTSNNAHSLAVWCRVRDGQRNKDDCRVPLFDDKGGELHQLMPADHIDVFICKQRLHAVVANVESLYENNNEKLLTLVAQSSDLTQARSYGMRFFGSKELSLNSMARFENLQLDWRRSEVQKNADRFHNTSLSWDCTDLMALNFLATGKAEEPKPTARFTIDVSEIEPDQVIICQGRVSFVLKVDRPERDGQTYKIHTVQYAPLNLETAPKTAEFRLLVNLRDKDKVFLARHAEPDLQCPVLLNWKVMDEPLVTLGAFQEARSLQPGDAICIQDEFPLYAHMPGLHAIVRRTEVPETNDSCVEVICFVSEGTDSGECLVGTKRVPVKGHLFSILNFNVSPDLLATRKDALMRAEARIGTGWYCCTWNSSRDLARWCCVNHKSNAPWHNGAVTKLEDLTVLSASQQHTKLRLQHLAEESGSIMIWGARLIDVRPLEDCANVLKLSLLETNWQARTVQIAKIDTREALKVKRILSGRDSVSESTARVLTNTATILLDLSLANASDRRLGSKVSDKSFCNWLRGLRHPGLAELPVLLSADSASKFEPTQDLEIIAELTDLKPWDQVVVERSKCAPLHLLVLEFDAESAFLSGYTYAPNGEHCPGRRLDMLMYFPPDESPYPMHKAIRRTPVEGDASSELSSSLAADSRFPDSAVGWAELCVQELQSDLLLSAQKCPLRELLKSMLRFAFRFAAGDFQNDGTLETCREVLASAKFAEALRDDGRNDDSTRRLCFLVRLIACLLSGGSTAH